MIEARRIALAFLAPAFPTAAQADALWDMFEARCLIPYEHVAPPDLRGLDPLGLVWRDPATGLIVTTTEDSCAVTGGTSMDLASLLAPREDYAEIGGGTWQSTTWREPRIEVTATPAGYAVTETDLEA